LIGASAAEDADPRMDTALLTSPLQQLAGQLDAINRPI
jgi:hypothetical protein